MNDTITITAENATLTLTPVELIEIERGVLSMWVNLTTGNETRSACYELVDGCWVYSTGDSEPCMPAALLTAWEGRAGDAALARCYEALNA
jgi:hypothetical protein